MVCPNSTLNLGFPEMESKQAYPSRPEGARRATPTRGGGSPVANDECQQ